MSSRMWNKEQHYVMKSTKIIYIDKMNGESLENLASIKNVVQRELELELEFVSSIKRPIMTYGTRLYMCSWDVSPS